MESNRRPGHLHYISPAGAGIVLVCFFLPWLHVSCAGKDMTLRGTDMGGWLWLVFVSAALVIASFFLLRNRPRYLGWAFLACSLAAIGILTFKTIEVMLDPNIPFYVPEKFIGFRLKIGAAGTIVGLLLTLSGAVLMQWGSPFRITRSQRKSGGVKDN